MVEFKVLEFEDEKVGEHHYRDHYLVQADSVEEAKAWMELRGYLVDGYYDYDADRQFATAMRFEKIRPGLYYAYQELMF